MNRNGNWGGGDEGIVLARQCHDENYKMSLSHLFSRSINIIYVLQLISSHRHQSDIR